MVLLLDCAEHRLQYRLDKRKASSNRSDDTEAAIAHRLAAYKEHTLPVVGQFGQIQIQKVGFVWVQGVRWFYAPLVFHRGVARLVSIDPSKKCHFILGGSRRDTGEGGLGSSPQPPTGYTPSLLTLLIGQRCKGRQSKVKVLFASMIL